ncbi:hypothetical protein BaRGS_00008552 [Batillaria attramentaria]|uniref:Uncharacterized protein n=1 Tax=Batillaria attramentaria TaxID=370345 RepID=A0ABD0LL99_9CAEN
MLSSPSSLLFPIHSLPSKPPTKNGDDAVQRVETPHPIHTGDSSNPQKPVPAPVTCKEKTSNDEEEKDAKVMLEVLGGTKSFGKDRYTDSGSPRQAPSRKACNDAGTFGKSGRLKPTSYH